MNADLQKAQKAFDQAKARLQLAHTKERTKARKADARAKILLGSAVLSIIGSMQADKREGFVAAIMKRVAERDRVFVSSMLTKALAKDDA